MTLKKFKKEVKNRKVLDNNENKSNDSTVTTQAKVEPVEIERKSDQTETNDFDFIKEITKSLPSGPNRGLLWDIVCSIFEPGVNNGLMVAIHFSFLSLLIVHLWLVYLTEGKEIHVWGLMALNMILYPCLLIFIALAYKDVNVKIEKKT